MVHVNKIGIKELLNTGLLNDKDGATPLDLLNAGQYEIGEMNIAQARLVIQALLVEGCQVDNAQIAMVLREVPGGQQFTGRYRAIETGQNT